VTKHWERDEARRLRREEGMPMKQIAARLSVSPGSVHLWTRDIEISPEHEERNRFEAQRLRGRNWARINRERRQDFQEEGRRWARRGDSLHEAGCMLYWAEGWKNRNGVIFANSDANMLRFFISFLRACFSVPDDRFRVRINVYLGNGLDVEAIEEHWLSALMLPRSCLRKHTIDHFPTSTSGQKKNQLPFGVCTLVLHDTRIAQHIYGAIQEYAGFDEPRWLDGPERKAA
jgi:hypothetical protein